MWLGFAGLQWLGSLPRDCEGGNTGKALVSGQKNWIRRGLLTVMRALMGVPPLLGGITEECVFHHWAVSNRSGTMVVVVGRAGFFPRLGGAVICGSKRKLCARQGSMPAKTTPIPFLVVFSKISLSFSPDGGQVKWWLNVWNTRRGCVVLCCFFLSFFSCFIWFST
jgi:hypothetical protein